jgi:hypothetical protein
MGIVYRGYHPVLDRAVAIKLLNAVSPSADAVRRFRVEAKALARVRHPNVIQVIDFGDVDKVPYIVLEFLGGGTLKERLTSGGPLRLDAALRVLRGVSAGLDAAHRRGVLHRDVKPANVLFAEDGTVVLSDFGLAKVSQDSVRTASGVVSGTPAYMSPEQFVGREATSSSDVYSLATMACEVLTGKLPFAGESLNELLYSKLQSEPISPTTLKPDLAVGIDQVILRGLRRNPDERWATCTALVDELEEVLVPGAVRGNREVGQVASIEASSDNRNQTIKASVTAARRVGFVGAVGALISSVGAVTAQLGDVAVLTGHGRSQAAVTIGYVAMVLGLIPVAIVLHRYARARWNTLSPLLLLVLVLSAPTYAAASAASGYFPSILGIPLTAGWLGVGLWLLCINQLLRRNPHWPAALVWVGTLVGVAWTALGTPLITVRAVAPALSYALTAYPVWAVWVGWILFERSRPATIETWKPFSITVAGALVLSGGVLALLAVSPNTSTTVARATCLTVPAGVMTVTCDVVATTNPAAAFDCSTGSMDASFQIFDSRAAPLRYQGGRCILSKSQTGTSGVITATSLSGDITVVIDFEASSIPDTGLTILVRCVAPQCLLIDVDTSSGGGLVAIREKSASGQFSTLASRTGQPRANGENRATFQVHDRTAKVWLNGQLLAQAAVSAPDNPGPVAVFGYFTGASSTVSIRRVWVFVP